jgi:hypothetical protein
MTFQNTFSWSRSRDDIFQRCLRQYWFHYYGSWGGWDLTADERTRNIYILKQLTTRKQWVGTKVHECISRALENMRRGIDPMGEQEAIDTTLAVMREDFANSRRSGYLQNPKSCGFLEHEYGMDISDAEWKESADHAASCLKTFYRSAVFADIRKTPLDRWLEIEKLSTFWLEGIKIYVQLDYSFRDKDGIVIYDWKTGTSDPEKNELQLACYSFYAVDKWKVGPEQVKTIEFNLASGEPYRHHLKGVDLDSIKKYIMGSVRDMKLLLDDPEHNRASEERFGFTDDEKECWRCNFRKLCPQWI